MTLDEAIKHCHDKAKELREQPFKEKMDIEDIANCEECAEEHEQLAQWLEELSDCRNELCLRCGQYKESHLGACDGCQWNDEHMKKWQDAPTIEERPTGEWIPVKYRPLNVDERKEFAEHYGIEYCDTINEKAFDCPMPEDGQEILISTAWGVRTDVAWNDMDGEGFVCYELENNDDWDGVDAWMPMPEPYKKGKEE